MTTFNHNLPFVSVIIPVYNDCDRLLICLHHLQKQSYPQEKYEIIVVDNGSKEPIKKCSLPGKVILLYEPQVGSYVARNKGLAVAQGEIIAFTDSDCQPAYDWLEMGVKSLVTTTNCGLVGGQIKVFSHNPANPTISEFYECIAAFPQAKFIQEYRFSATANTFTFRHVIDKVGGFSQSLKSGGDAEWGYRVYAQGYQLHYAEDVVIAHPARRSLRELLAKEVRIAGGLYEKNLPRKPTMRKLARGFVPPLRTIRGTLYDLRPLTHKQSVYLVVALVLLHYVRAGETLRLRLGGKSRR